jgi:signal transduction histidine kinase
MLAPVENIPPAAFDKTLENSVMREQIGTVVVTYTNKQPPDRTLAWLSPIAASLMIEMFFGVLISIFLSRKIFGAIREMVHASSMLTKRGFKPKFETMLMGEFGVLQQAFLDMYQMMKNYTADLEKKVDQRTSDLHQQTMLLKQATEDKRLLIITSNQAIEHERRKIAFDLHDTMNTIVISMLGQARSAKMELEKMNQPILFSGPIESMTKIEKDASAIYKLSRDLVSNLRPEVLDTFGLDEALDYLVSKHQEVDATCAYHYHSIPGFPPLNYDFNIVVYRILQECLSNITKHAHATSCEVSLNHRNTSHGLYVALAIKDNGAGFDPSLRTQSTGLVGMRERAESIGGKLLISCAANLALQGGVKSADGNAVVSTFDRACQA